MIRRGIVVLLLCIGFLFCTSLCLSLQAKVARASQTAYTIIVVASPSATPTQIATPTPTRTSSSSSDANGWTSPAIVVGIIIAVIGILGTLTGIFLQQLFTSRSERKKEEREEQRRKETDEKAARDEQKKLQEEQDRRVAEEEAQKKALDEHVRSYREMLRQDDTVTSIKILDMTRPVEVANVYVQLKLRQDIRANPTGMLQALQKELNPNIILQVDRQRLEENYTKQAIDPVQALRDNRQCLLLGDPGAGKTTLLKYLTVQALDQHLSGLPDLPIYVELSRFAESGRESLVEFAAERWERFYGFPRAQARAYIEQQLEAGNVILLLDALDECAVGKNEDAREASYRRVFEAITQVATRYPKAYIVVTARIAGYKQRASLTAFTELEVLEFRTEDIREFVNKWFMSPDAQKVQKGKDLNAQLANNIRIQTLAANPLLLSLTVILYERRRGRLPERRAELYKLCVEMLLDEWDRKYKRVQRFSGLSVENKRRLLEMVAWHFHGRNERYFLNEQLLALIEKFLLDTGLKADQQEQVLEEISADTGLLKEQAEGWYGFLHLTFQEYFVARYVVDNGLLDELLTHRGEPWWEEVILLYVGSILKVKPLIEKLLAMEDDIFETNMLLAGRCLAASAGMDQEAAPLQQQIVVQLFELLEGTSYDANKNRAAAVLAELGRTDEEINTHLLDILSDTTSTREIKKGISLALGTYGQRALVGRLLPMLFDTHLQEITRARITSIIGNLADTSIIDTLLPKLQDKSTDSLIREHSVSILVRLGDRSLSSQLLPLLLDDKEDMNVRTQVVFGWHQIGDPQDTPYLAAKLLDPQMNDIATYIPFALAAFQNDHSVVSSLLTFASHAQGVFIINFRPIANILGGLRNPTVTNEIVRLIADRQVDLSIRKNLVTSLGNVAHKSAIAELQSIYADAYTEQELKEEIAQTLYILGDRTIPVDTDKILRAAFVVGTFERYILEQMDVSAQLQMLADAQMSLGVRQYIASMLANSTDTSIVPPLCKLATNRVVNVNVREAVIDTLGKIANDRATVEALVELLNSDRQVRDVVVDALWYVSRRARVRVVKDEMTRRVKVMR